MRGPSLGLDSGAVVVVPYDPRWPEIFRAEAARILAEVREPGLILEHTGSTSIPGLPAKPVLDILGGYHDSSTLPALIRGLQRAGYVHRGQQGIPGREFFRRGDPRSYHLHLTQVGSNFWIDHMTFRDQLRDHAELRDAYGELKLLLAERHPRDREAYIEGKTAFVLRVLRDARSR